MSLQCHLPTLAVLTIFTILATGCRIDTHHGDGKSDNVDIATPFGGLSVKTDAAAGDTGMTVYPGAQLMPKDHGDNGAADVNLSFGKFSLRVKAASYRTPDNPDKVITFYKKDLTRYGTVIQCSDNHPVGNPVRTPDGLTCDNEHDNHINSDVSSKLELKTGSKQHQHIVAIDPEGSSTKIGLVALDLPSHISLDHDSEDEHKQ